MTGLPVPPWAGRPVMVCSGGPLDRRWYFADDWARVVDSAKRMGAGNALGYRRTSGIMPNPQFAVTGTAWRWIG